MKHLGKSAILAVAIVVAGACDTSGPEPSQPALNYFPLQTGLYQIYRVEEVRYSVVEGAVESSYQLMLEIVDSISTDEGYKYVIHRSTRSDETSPWQYIDSWSAMVTNFNVIVDEGGVSYVKLAFPAGDGKTWDGNTYNIKGEDEYEMEDVGKPYATDEQEFEDCIVVNQNDLDDPIVSKDMRKEIYARGIGLVVKEVSQLNYCTDPDCLGQKKIEDGIELTQRILEYGIR